MANMDATTLFERGLLMQVSYKYCCSAVHFIFSHVVLYKLVMSVVCKNVVSYFVTLG
jgi:hypothetical protein